MQAKGTILNTSNNQLTEEATLILDQTGITVTTNDETVTFTARFEELKKVKITMATLHFYTQNGLYSFEIFSKYKSSFNTSDYMLKRLDRDTKIDEWVSALKSKNVTVAFFGSKKTRPLGIAIGIILVVATVLYAALSLAR